MTTLEQILFGNGDYNQKKSFIDDMSVDELMSVTKTIVKSIITKAGNEDGYMGIRRDFRVGNKWNSEIEGIYLYKDKLYVGIYVQNDSTDTTTSEEFNVFFRRGEYYSMKNSLNMGVDYSEGQKAEVMRSILYQCIYILFSDEHKKAELIEKLSHYSIINPVANHFYHKYNLNYDISKYTSSDRVANKKAYYHAERTLREYIEENYLMLVDKSNEELDKIYKEVFQKAMNEFIKSFDYNKWRSETTFYW